MFYVRGRGGCRQDFGGKTERTRPLVRWRYKWEGNIKMCLQEMGWGPLTGLFRTGAGGVLL